MEYEKDTVNNIKKLVHPQFWRHHYVIVKWLEQSGICQTRVVQNCITPRRDVCLPGDCVVRSRTAGIHRVRTPGLTSAATVQEQG